MPCRRAELAEHLVLCLSPERPRHVEHPSALPREPHGPDAPVGVRHTLDYTITLQKAEAARQCRLVDGQHRLKLSDVRLAASCDGRENTELRHPEPARPEDIVVQLSDGTADHTERATHARG